MIRARAAPSMDRPGNASRGRMARGWQGTDIGVTPLVAAAGRAARSAPHEFPDRIVPPLFAASVKTRNSRAFLGRHPANFTICLPSSPQTAPRGPGRVTRAPFAWETPVAKGTSGTIASDDRHHVRHGRKPANPCGDTRASALTRGQA